MAKLKALETLAIAAFVVLVVVQGVKSDLDHEEREYKFLIACLNEHRYKVACEEMRKALESNEGKRVQLEMSTKVTCGLYDIKRIERENMAREDSLGECNTEVPDQAGPFGLQMAQEEINKIIRSR